MGLEPIGELDEVFFHAGPAVVLARQADQLVDGSGIPGFFLEDLRLVDGYQSVGFAVDHQRGGHALGDKVDRGDGAAVFEAAFQGVGRAAEGSVELSSNLADADLGVARGSPVFKVGGREEAGHGLHTTALSVDRIFGLRVAVVTLGSQGERQMAAGAGTGDAETVGPHGIIGRMMADPANRSMHVFRDLKDGESGLGTMDDGEDGVALVEQGFAVGRINSVMVGIKSAANDPDDANAIGLGRL